MRIVVVDDHPVMTDRNRQALEKLGASFFRKENLAHDQRATESESQPALLLLDLSKMDKPSSEKDADTGISTRSLNRVPPIALTRLLAAHEGTAMDQSGELRFMPRPVPLSVLVQWLDRHESEAA